MESMKAFERFCRRKRREEKREASQIAFIGMENALSFLSGDNHVVVINGPEGCGKTELVKKFLSLNRNKQFIWIYAGSEASIIQEFEIFAYKTLSLKPADNQSTAKDISTLVKEVCSHLGENVILVLDGLENFEDLSCLVAGKKGVPVSKLELPFRKILITSRKEDIPVHGAVLSLQGFTLAEAIDLIQREIPYASDGDAIELSRSCHFNPKKILRKIEEIKKNILLRDQKYQRKLSDDDLSFDWYN